VNSPLDEIYWSRKTLMDDVDRGYEDLLRPCAHALDDFVGDLYSGPFPSDWRLRWRAFVDLWRGQGRMNDAASLSEFETWMEAWAMFTGRLPDNGRYQMVQQEGMWVPYRVGASGARSMASDDRRLPPGTAPVTLAVYHPPLNKDLKASGADPTRSEPDPASKSDATDTAGSGPTTSAAFQEKVRLALQILDPKVARWWKAPSVRGVVRSRDATSWPAAWRFNAFSEMNGGQPIITVDMHFTAGETAQAILREVESGWFADSIGAYYRRYRFATTGAFEEFRKWQQGAAREAARLASVMAELYYNSIASLTPGGDLVLTVGDVAEHCPRWEHLLSVLPLLGHLPVGAIILKLGKRTIKLPKALVRRLETLGTKERKALLERAESVAKTDDEARSIIEHALADVPPEHHIATNKDWVSNVRGGPWSPAFEKLFKKAGMSLEDVANRVQIPGHRGPHPEEYHRAIFDRLSAATLGKNGVEY
jgi:hypothetical protein